MTDVNSFFEWLLKKTNRLCSYARDCSCGIEKVVSKNSPKLAQSKKTSMTVEKINEKLKSCKFVHVMYNDKFNKPFVDFLNTYFDVNEHVILCKRWKQFDGVIPFPAGENVIEFESFDGINMDLSNIDKVICHSLFDRWLVKYLYENQSVLTQKAYWAIWGGDLYNAKRDEMNDYVRRNFKGYINIIDEKYARKKYGIKGRTFHEAYISSPITKEMINNVEKNQKDYIQVQINNSCDDSTLEILDILSRWKDKNIKVTTVLSYGKMEYKNDIVQKGQDIFGENFSFIDNYLSPAEYVQYLAQNDVLIMNQNRQQGLGNISVSQSLGVKVFVRNDVSTYEVLNSVGQKVFDTKELKNLSFTEFLCNEQKEETRQNVLKKLNDEKSAELWTAVFNAK